MSVKVQRPKVLTDTIPAAKRALTGASPRRVILTSPYVTSGDEALAETVVAEGDPSHTVVLTTFDLMTFATGGSSLATLRKLLKLCDLRSLPGLHAKVVLTDGVQIVGSQNLTAGGTRNKEIGLRLSDPTVADSLREELEGWIKEAKPITEARIRDMERRVAKLEDLAARLKEAAREADAEADPVTGQAAHGRGREPRLADAIRGSDAGFEAKAVAYRGRTNISPTVGRQGLDLTSWRSEDGKQAGLKLLTRYLLVGPDGQMGWTRLSKECLGWVDVSRNPTAILKIGDFNCKFAEVRFIDRHADGGANVEFDLVDPRSGQDAVVRASFALDGFRGIRVAGSGKLKANLSSLARERPAEFQGALADALLRPFRYKERSRGEGVVPFLSAQPGQRYVLRLHRLHNFRTQNFLVLDEA